MNIPPIPEKKKNDHPTYPWAYDEDVITTGESLKTAEKLTKTKLSDASVVNSGIDMIDQYDNNRRVWERNLPFGNSWDKNGPHLAPSE